MRPLRIIFAGTPEFGLPCLNAIHQSPHEIIAVYTQPDRPAGRGLKLQHSAIKKWALHHHVPIYQIKHFQNEAVAQLQALQPDVMVVIAYGLLLPTTVLSLPRFGCINVHASLLPRWRGASPLQQTILHGDDITGITIMQMDKGMDTGNIVTQIHYDILPQETTASLHDALANLAVEPLLSTLNLLAVTGHLDGQKQDNALASYAPKIKKEDAHINWKNSAFAIERQIRAFIPWPVAFTYVNEELLRIHHAIVEEQDSTKPPGTVIACDKNGILVVTGNQCLRILTLQFAGRKVLRVADWINAGHSLLNLTLQ